MEEGASATSVTLESPRTPSTPTSKGLKVLVKWGGQLVWYGSPPRARYAGGHARLLTLPDGALSLEELLRILRALIGQVESTPRAELASPPPIVCKYQLVDDNGFDELVRRRKLRTQVRV
jgi:hypothetical protein